MRLDDQPPPAILPKRQDPSSCADKTSNPVIYINHPPSSSPKGRTRPPAPTKPASSTSTSPRHPPQRGGPFFTMPPATSPSPRPSRADRRPDHRFGQQT